MKSKEFHLQNASQYSQEDAENVTTWIKRLAIYSLGTYTNAKPVKAIVNPHKPNSITYYGAYYEDNGAPRLYLLGYKPDSIIYKRRKHVYQDETGNSWYISGYVQTWKDLTPEQKQMHPFGDWFGLFQSNELLTYNQQKTIDIAFYFI